MTDKEKRDKAVDEYAEAIKARLDEQASKGYTGWDGEYPRESLCMEILEDARNLLVHDGKSRKDALDIGARGMMLWMRSL